MTTERKVILIDDPAVSDPDWIKKVQAKREAAETKRRQRALTAALNESTLKAPTN